MLFARVLAVISIVMALAGASCEPQNSTPKAQTVWAWGSNLFGQTGYPHGFIDVGPQRVGLADVISIAAGKSHSVALKGDGTVWQWGTVASLNNVGEGNPRPCPNKPAKGTWPFPLDFACDVRPTQVSNLGKARSIEAGSNFTLAIMDDHSFCRWGNNWWGQLGNGGTSSYEVTDPVCTTPPTRLDFTWVYGGGGSDYNPAADGPDEGGHALVLARSLPAGSSGQFRVLTWGRNDHWQTGDSSVCDKCVLEPSSFPYPGNKQLVDVIDMDAGGAHSLALKGDGTVWAWGSQDEGQLGAPSITDNISTPTQVVSSGWPPPYTPLDNVFSVAAGYNFSLALKRDGTVWAWGSNTFGATSVRPNNSGFPIIQQFARQIPGLDNVSRIAAGDGFALALKKDGTVWAWGRNDHMQLGVSSSDKCGPQRALDCSFSPIQVENLVGVTAIAAGGAHALALAAS
jgi:alpha-tubulin suppressor-like RCC1 family protein